MLKKTIALMMIMMAVTFSVFALGTSDAETEDSALPEYRDTIRFASGSDQNYMDGQMNNTNDVYLRAVYSQLVRRALDGSIEGDLAESWSVGEDGVTWTFNLYLCRCCRLIQKAPR